MAGYEWLIPSLSVSLRDHVVYARNIGYSKKVFPTLLFDGYPGSLFISTLVITL